jgi:molybdopterin converting factor subunit 1
MRCEVLLFANVRQAIGKDRLTLELPDGATVKDALDRLAEQHEIISLMGNRLAIAVDERYQPRTSLLNDGCTVALIPPVSGG